MIFATIRLYAVVTCDDGNETVVKKLREEEYADNGLTSSAGTGLDNSASVAAMSPQGLHNESIVNDEDEMDNQ